ncbi:MAG: hypothetical protein V4794_10035 [Pseudomonadota bacterium]
MKMLACNGFGIDGVLLFNEHWIIDIRDCLRENYLELYLIEPAKKQFLWGSAALACCDDLGIVPIEMIRAAVPDGSFGEEIFLSFNSIKRRNLHTNLIAFDAICSIKESGMIGVTGNLNHPNDSTQIDRYFEPVGREMIERCQKCIATGQ